MKYKIKYGDDYVEVDDNVSDFEKDILINDARDLEDTLEFVFDKDRGVIDVSDGQE